MKTRAAISEGRTIAEPLEASRACFPGMVVQMIAVGESDRCHGQRCCRRSPTSTTTRWTPRSPLTSLLEPLMMVFLGGTIGGLLMAMYLPIFKIAENIK